MNIFVKIRDYINYRKLINKNEIFFLRKYNVRVDRISRLYTTISVPIEKQNEIRERNFQKREYEVFENDNYLNDEVGKFLSGLSDDLRAIGAYNYLKVPPTILRPDLVNIDIIYEYKDLNIVKLVNRMRFINIFTFLISIPIYFYFHLFFIIPVGLFLMSLILNKKIFKKFII